MPNNPSQDDTRPVFDLEGHALAPWHDPILDFEAVISGTDLPERFGVKVLPDQDVRKLRPALTQIDSIDIVFPAFRDGRGYSSARILREILGFKGHLCATGDVLRDQLGYLIRCGFDGFQIRDSDPTEAVRQAKTRYGVAYQNAAESQPTAWAVRKHGDFQ